MTHRPSSLDVYGDRTIGEMFKRLILDSHINILNYIVHNHCGIPETKRDQVTIREVAKRVWLDPTKRKFEQLVDLCFVNHNLPKIGKE